MHINLYFSKKEGPEMELGKIRKLKNFKEHEVDWLVDKSQVQAILDGLFEAIDEVGMPKKGTFILAGQRKGESVQKIVDFEFPGGKQKNFVGQDRDSRLIAENVIYDASTYSYRGDERVITSLYNTPQIMSLELPHSRFLAAYFADNGSFSDQDIVYNRLAGTIKKVLQ